jgi:hypothetical protein
VTRRVVFFAFGVICFEKGFEDVWLVNLRDSNPLINDLENNFADLDIFLVDFVVADDANSVALL